MTASNKIVLERLKEKENQYPEKETEADKEIRSKMIFVY